MDAASPLLKLLAEREHRIYSARSGQISNNLLAWKGGRPYVEARLWRAPNESDLSWSGVSNSVLGIVKQGTTGRIQRTPLVNDAGRIVQKISQYLFAEDAKREGVREDWAADVTTTGLSLRQYWQTVSEYVTCSGWCFLGADRGSPMLDPETGRPMPRTLAQREQVGDRVYWSIWPATDVVDWNFDPQGGLRWVITQETLYQNDDPLAEAAAEKVRTLWRAGDGREGATWQRVVIAEGGKVSDAGAGAISSPRVPFLCVGIPSTDPWWFDDAEAVQAALLNLGSLHLENLIRAVYPQLVISQATVASVEAKLVERLGQSQGYPAVEVVREVIRGLDYPFVESEAENGITRYLTPNATDLEAIPKQVETLRRQLFDSVGLALFNRETRQVQSAEAKRFDHLDTATTLKHRALLLQDAEARMVALSRELDSTFPAYTAAWPQEFSVPTTAEDVASLVQLANVAELPPAMSRQVLRSAVDLMDQIRHIDPAKRAEIMAEIDELTERLDMADDDGTPPPAGGDNNGRREPGVVDAD